MQSIKQKHIELENMLFTTEKLCSMAELNGLYAWNGEAFEKVEKSLAMLEFHDIASGTCAQDGEKSACGRQILRLSFCSRSLTRRSFPCVPSMSRRGEGNSRYSCLIRSLMSGIPYVRPSS